MSAGNGMFTINVSGDADELRDALERVATAVAWMDGVDVTFELIDVFEEGE